MPESGTKLPNTDTFGRVLDDMQTLAAFGMTGDGTVQLQEFVDRLKALRGTQQAQDSPYLYRWRCKDHGGFVTERGPDLNGFKPSCPWCGDEMTVNNG